MPPAINRSMSTLEWGLLLSLSVLWGGSFFFNAVALTAIPPFTLVAARTVVGAALLFLTMRATGALFPLRRDIWVAFAVMGLLNNVAPFSLFAWGQTQIESGLASILNATTPLFTVVAANFLTADEKMTPARIAGVVIGFVGVVIMIGADALQEAGGHLLAEFACLGAAACYATSAIYARRFARMGSPPLATATGQILAASLVMVPLALVIDHPWTLPMPGLAPIGAVLGIAALSTFLAYLIYYRILASAGAVNVMLVTFLIPISAIILGALILGERLHANHFVGMALIGAGLACIDGRVFTVFRRAPAR
jgi:drug/metabolite transporter (DMT)-like permease